MTETAKSTDNDLVLNDQIKAVMKQLPLILLINLPLVLVLSWLYWPWVNQTELLFWAACMFILMVSRFLALIYMGPGLVRRLSEDHQQWVLVTNSALSGILWAWAGVLFFVEGKLDYQLIILMVLIVKGTGSVSSIINSLPAFYAYFPISMIPITLLFLLQKDMTSIMLGVISFVFTLVMLWFARNLNRTVLESIRMRYENRLLLEETEKRKQQAEKANLAKTQFLAAASHDLRQPIHAMSLLLNVLEERKDNDQPIDIVNKMRGTVNSLQSLLNALLDMSRLDSGSVKANKEVVNLENIFTQLHLEFQVLAQEKQLTLLFSSEDLAVQTDPMLLEQVLRNLIANAIRYTHTGTVSVEAKLCENKGENHQQKVVLSIADTGIGITQEEQQSIFEEFYQVGNQQRDRDHGLGLGLAIVQRVVKLLGSEIELESTLGEGSCFRFALDLSPVRQELKPRSSEVPRPYQTKETRMALNQSIVVLEDDRQVAEAMQTLLESWGCQTVIGHNADVIIKQLIHNKQTPNAIISDYQLANTLNGIEESQKIAEEFNYDIPTLIMTGNIEAEQLEAVKQSGLPVLYKPVPPARLRAFLRSTDLTRA